MSESKQSSVEELGHYSLAFFCLIVKCQSEGESERGGKKQTGRGEKREMQREEEKESKERESNERGHRYGWREGELEIGLR